MDDNVSHNHLFEVTFKHGCKQKDMYLQFMGTDTSEIPKWLNKHYKHVTLINVIDHGRCNPITGKQEFDEVND